MVSPYKNHRTMKNKYNTHVWTAWLLSCMTASLLTYNPAHQLVITAILVTVSIRLRVDWITHLKIGLLLGAFPLIINTFFYHIGEHILFRIPPKLNVFAITIPVYFISGPITLECVTFGLTMTLLFVNMIICYGVFNNQVDSDKILGIIPSRLSHSGLLAAIALRFTPTIVGDIKSITEAQRARGLNLKTGNLLQRISNHKALFTPTIVNSLERSLQLAEAMEARGYNRGRTKHSQVTWSWRDYLATGVITASVASLVYFKLTGPLGYWPHESLALPDTHTGVLLAILLLVVTAL